MLTAQTTTVPHPDVVSTTLPSGEAVLLHLGTQTYYSLNATGTRIWRLIEQHQTIEQIASSLQSVFDVSAETATRSVLKLTEDLIAAKLAVEEV